MMIVGLSSLSDSQFIFLTCGYARRRQENGDAVENVVLMCVAVEDGEVSLSVERHFPYSLGLVVGGRNRFVLCDDSSITFWYAARVEGEEQWIRESIVEEVEGIISPLAFRGDVLVASETNSHRPTGSRTNLRIYQRTGIEGWQCIQGLSGGGAVATGSPQCALILPTGQIPVLYRIWGESEEPNPNYIILWILNPEGRWVPGDRIDLGEAFYHCMLVGVNGQFHLYNRFGRAGLRTITCVFDEVAEGESPTEDTQSRPLEQ